MTHEQRPLDLIIIGGGLAGVICLYYARQAGLRVRLFERASRVGGLWTRLPAWQDIQVNRLDWTLGDLPLGGETQPHIAENVQAWVDRFDLAPAICLNSPVSRARREGELWEVSTPEGIHRARYLVSATGIHNRPHLPAIERDRVRLKEFHSSALQEPALLTGCEVVVVGGGASAFDLLDLCFLHRARRVHWVYRGLRWMAPTLKPKAQAGGPRGLARWQMQGLSMDQINAQVDQDLRQRYQAHGMQAVLPGGRFDMRHDQLIPGRCRMVAHFDEIVRHPAEVRAVRGSTLHLSDGDEIDAQVLLWGTGYRLDLSYFDAPSLASLDQSAALARRCGSLFCSIDQPDLFFLAPCLLETTGAAPWAYAHASRSIVSHLIGTACFGPHVLPDKVNHFDLLRVLGECDPRHFPAPDWEHHYRRLAFEHPADRPLPLPRWSCGCEQTVCIGQTDD